MKEIVLNLHGSNYFSSLVNTCNLVVLQASLLSFFSSVPNANMPFGTFHVFLPERLHQIQSDNCYRLDMRISLSNDSQKH
jgi:hypothetical protein